MVIFNIASADIDESQLMCYIEDDHKVERIEDRPTWIMTWTHFSRRTIAEIGFTVHQYQQTFGL
jgi:hypothetical protein